MQRIITRCVALAIFFIPALGFSKAPSTRRFLIPDHGTLVLLTPKAWKDDLRQPPDNLPPTITFSPSAGLPFKVIVTAGWGEKPGGQLLDTTTIREQVESAAKSAESQSVEKSLAVKEFTGPASHGFYFSATDQAPKPGEYISLTQGIAKVGDICLIFTILTNDGQEAIEAAALEIIRGAVLQLDGGVSAETTVVNIPGQDWAISFKCPPLFDKEEKNSKEGYGFRANSGFFNLSLFVETPKGPGTEHKDCYAYYWPIVQRDHAIAKGTVVAAQNANYFRVQYDIVEKFQGKPIRMQNVNYYIAYEGKWIDIHISFVEPTPADEKIFATFDSSLKVGK
jgi:hypothetical protein